MANRALRSRTVEVSQEICEITAEESPSDWPSAQPEVLGSASEHIESQSDDRGLVTPDDTVEQREVMAECRDEASKETSATVPSNLQDLFNGMLAAFKESQATVESKLNKLEESNTKLAESNARLENSLRADIRSENEKLIKRFEAENHKLSKEFSDRLLSETKRFAQLIGQVQKETEVELVAVRRQLEVTSSEFDNKLEQANSQTNAILDEIASKVIENRSEIESNGGSHGDWNTLRAFGVRNQQRLTCKSMAIRRGEFLEGRAQ
jgi:hypothetical protein